MQSVRKHCQGTYRTNVICLDNFVHGSASINFAFVILFRFRLPGARLLQGAPITFRMHQNIAQSCPNDPQGSPKVSLSQIHTRQSKMSAALQPLVVASCSLVTLMSMSRVYRSCFFSLWSPPGETSDLVMGKKTTDMKTV